MSGIPIPNGAKVALAYVFGAPVPIEDISNAKPAIATSAGHTLATKSIVLLNTPSWSDADNQVQRVGVVASGTFAMPGLDTTDVSQFPVDGGAGSAKLLDAWTQLPKIPSFEMAGGDAKAQTTEYLDYEKDLEFFTGTTAERLNFSISYEPDGAAHAALIAASKLDTVVVLRLVLKDGATLYYPGLLHYNATPVTTKNQEMVCKGSLALQAPITRFAKA